MSVVGIVGQALSAGAGRVHLGVSQPTPNFGGPGVAALKTIANVVAAIVLTLCVIGFLVAAGMVAFGHFARHSEMQSAGVKGIIGCVIAAAVVGGAAGLVNFGLGLKVA